MSTIGFTRGNTGIFTISFTKDGTPQDITGATIVFTASTINGPSFTSSTLDGDITLTAPTRGVARMAVPPDHTSSFPNTKVNLQYQVIITDAIGNVTTSETGTLEIYPNL